MDVKTPANINRFMLYFISLCTFDLIDTDDAISAVFDFPDFGAYNLNF